MNEVEKMYENAGVEINKYKVCCTGCKHIAKLEIINGCPSKWFCDKYDDFADCDKAELDHSLFTAEKQIELIKWLAKSKSDITICYSNATERFAISKRGGYCVSEDFAAALAMKINLLWQALTEEERTQIKEILE